MAKAMSSEELQLKKRARRRLVGAIALVLIVVVFLPMLLDNEPKPVSQDVEIHIPSSAEADGAETESTASLRFTPVEPSESKSPEVIQRPPEPQPLPSTGEDEPEDVRQEPAQKAPATEIKPIVSAKPASQPSKKEEFVVQLGAFSDAGNAARLAAKLRENRFEAYTEVVTTSAGKRTRVRVGPFDSRTAAEQARDRLKARKLTYGEPAIMRAAD